MITKKTTAALVSVGSNTALIAMKLVVGILSGSVSIISEAIHSSMDWVAAAIALFSVRLSDKPADDKHPFGHGKIENISGLIEAVIIVVAAVWIIIEAANKIIHPGEVHIAGLGFMIMLVSAAVNWIVAILLYRVAKKEDSVALEADALHHKADVITSGAVALGLLVIWIFRINILDPILAIAVSIFILKEAFELTVKAFEPIMDSSLSTEEIKIIKTAIEGKPDHYCDYHELRTRKSGKTRYIDLHLTLPRDTPLETATEVASMVKKEIETHLVNTHILIQTESCSENCSTCKVNPSGRDHHL